MSKHDLADVIVLVAFIAVIGAITIAALYFLAN